MIVKQLVKDRFFQIAAFAAMLLISVEITRRATVYVVEFQNSVSFPDIVHRNFLYKIIGIKVHASAKVTSCMSAPENGFTCWGIVGRSGYAVVLDDAQLSHAVTNMAESERCSRVINSYFKDGLAYLGSECVFYKLSDGTEIYLARNATSSHCMIRTKLEK